MTECSQSGCIHSGLKQPPVCHSGCQSSTEMLPKVSSCKDDSGVCFMAPFMQQLRRCQGLCNQQLAQTQWQLEILFFLSW